MTGEALLTLVAIEAVLAAAAFALARRDVALGLVYLLAATAPLEIYRTTVGGVNPSLFRLSLVLAAAVVGWGWLRERDPRAVAARLLRLKPALAYAALAAVVVATLVLDSQSSSFLGRRLALLILMGIATIAVMAELARRLTVEQVARAFVLGSVLPVLAAAWQSLAPHVGASPALPLVEHLPLTVEGTTRSLTFFGTEAVREKGPFIDPNFLGAYLAVVCSVCSGLLVAAFVRGARRSAVVPAAVLPAAVVTLVATYSRTAYVALVLDLVVLAVLLAPHIRRVRLPRRHLRRVAVIGVACLLALVPVAPGVLSRLDPSAGENPQSNALHEFNLRGGLQQFRAHPILGVGAGELGTHLNQYPNSSYADSTFVTTAAELGVVGLFILLLAVGWTLEALARAYLPARRAAAGVLPAALMAGYLGYAASNTIYDAWWRDWHFVALGLMLVVARAAPDPEPQP